MNQQISYCPFCGTEFDDVSDDYDSRSASGFECEDCNEKLEIRVTQFPMA